MRGASYLEPISKSPEEDDQASELNEAEEVLWVILPSDEDATLPLNPCEEALDHPAPCVSPQPASILGGRPAAIGSVRRDHLDAVSAQFHIQRIAVVGAISDQIFGLGFDHVEIEAQLNQAYFVMVRCMRTDRERQTMTIYNRHDFQAFSSFRRADVRATALRHCKGRVDKATLLRPAPHAREVRWRCQSGLGAEPRSDTKSETGDAPFCNSDNTAAACATAPRCSKSTTSLQEFSATELASDQGAPQKCSLPENDAGYVPNPNRSAESSNTYSPSAITRNFEIGSSHLRPD